MFTKLPDHIRLKFPSPGPELLPQNVPVAWRLESYVTRWLLEQAVCLPLPSPPQAPRGRGHTFRPRTPVPSASRRHGAGPCRCFGANLTHQWLDWKSPSTPGIWADHLAPVEESGTVVRPGRQHGVPGGPEHTLSQTLSS